MATAGLPAILATYLRAEQRLGRIDKTADIDAAVTLVVGAIHGQILPRVTFQPAGQPDHRSPRAGGAARGDGPRAGITPAPPRP